MRSRVTSEEVFPRVKPEPYILKHPVPTPEELAEMMGVSLERVSAIRKIMDAPASGKASAGKSPRKKPVLEPKAKRILAKS